MLKCFKLLALLLFITPAYADGLVVPPPQLPLSVANGGTGVTSSTGTGSVVLSTSPSLTTPSLGVATATSINGVTLDNNAWTTFNPVVTCASGAPTYVSSGRYKIIGKTVFFNTQITISALSSCTGNLSMTMPVTAASGTYPGSGYNAGSGVSVVFVANGSAAVSVTTVAATTYYFSTVYQSI